MQAIIQTQQEHMEKLSSQPSLPRMGCKTQFDTKVRTSSSAHRQRKDSSLETYSGMICRTQF